MTILSSDVSSVIIDTDSYKVSHWFQYPEGTEYVSSYIEPRSSKFAKMLGEEYNYAVFFGLQAYLKEYLATPITQDDIEIAERMFKLHGEPFNKEGWQYILDKYNGKLPLEVSAVPEGTVLNTGNAIVQIINTDPKCFWLTSYVETAMLSAVWYPTTVATKSRIMKEMLRKELEDTCDTPDAVIDFMLHDFGARGNNSREGRGLGGMAHLVNFKGTDTVQGMVAEACNYEPAFDKCLADNPGEPKKAMIKYLDGLLETGGTLAGFSVIASEHSTMTIKGKDGEKSQIKRLIDKAKEGKIVSIVSDSYNYFDSVTNNFGGEFKQDILEAGKNGGRVVIRPDSGDPIEVICKTLDILEEKFGTTTNNKGFKVLPSCVRVLQGDGIDMDTLRDILIAVKKKGFSVENLVFGMGGGLEQKVNRDDLGFAQKASAACINGVWNDVYKDPHTGEMTFSKKSKKGILATIWDKVAFKTIRRSELKPGEADALTPVFRNGEVLKTYAFETVRKTTEFFTKLVMKKPTTAVEKPWAKAMEASV